MSGDYYRGLGDLRQRRDAFDGVLRTLSGRIDDCSRLRTAARAALARKALDLAVATFYRDQIRDCDEAMELAAEIYPPIRGDADFVRLRRRRMLGHTACKLLRRVASVFRPPARGRRRGRRQSGAPVNATGGGCPGEPGPPVISHASVDQTL
jgi:hypothetical protein